MGSMDSVNRSAFSKSGIQRKRLVVVFRDDEDGRDPFPTKPPQSSSSSPSSFSSLTELDPGAAGGMDPAAVKLSAKSPASSGTNATAPLSSSDSSGSSTGADETLLCDVRGHLSVIKRLLKDVEQSSSSRRSKSSTGSHGSDRRAMYAKQEIRRNQSKLCVPSLRSEANESKLALSSNTYENELSPKSGITREIRRLSVTLQEIPNASCTENELEHFHSCPTLRTGMHRDDGTPSFIDKVKSLQEQATAILPVSPRTHRRRSRFQDIRRQVGVCPRSRLPHLPPVPPPPLGEQYTKETSVNDTSPIISDSLLSYRPRSTRANRARRMPDTNESEIAKPDAPPAEPTTKYPSPPSSHQTRVLPKPQNLRQDTDDNLDTLSLFSYPEEKQKDESMTVMATMDSVYPLNESNSRGPRREGRAKSRQRSASKQRVVRTASKTPRRRGSRYGKSPHFQNDYEDGIERIGKMKRDLDQRKKERSRSLSKQRPLRSC